MSGRILGVLPLAFVVACGGADPDGDGLTNAEERELGTDKKLADSDGDGLDDAAEIDAGLDPLDDDSDGDGMLDGDEVLYGFDPLDPRSDGYRGGWPMQEVAIKDAIEAAKSTSDRMAEGDRFPRLMLRDQYNDVVDLYDFAGHGKKIFVDLSAEWCPPCRDMAEWLAGDKPGYYPDEIMEAVNDGDVLWLTVMSEDYRRNPASLETVKDAWHEAYPNHHIPVLADAKQEASLYIYAPGIPSLSLLNENMTVIVADDTPGAMQRILDEL